MEDATQIQNAEGYNLFKIESRADAVPGDQDQSLIIRERWQIRNQVFDDQMTRRLLEALEKAEAVAIPVTLKDGTHLNATWSVTDSRTSGIGGIFFDLTWEPETGPGRAQIGNKQSS